MVEISSTGWRILIADDNKAFREFIKNALRLSLISATYDEAENGREAVDKAKSAKPDLVILDISMPVMDGVEAAKSLKKEMPELPILFYTAHDYRQESAEDLGVDAVVCKRDGPAKLAASARALLEQQQAKGPDQITAKTHGSGYPWQKLVRHAMKSNAKERDADIRVAEAAIFARIQALSHSRGQHDERQALADALQALRKVKKEQKDRIA